MGRMCSVPGCTSNYHRHKKRHITTFTFPSDRDQREKWVHAIRRPDFVPGKSACVCIKHFPESDIIRVDSVKRPDGTILSLPRRIPKLTHNAFPKIFCGQPSYLSQPTSAKRKLSEIRMKKVLQQDELNFRVWCEEDKILNCQDLVGSKMDNSDEDHSIDNKMEIKVEPWWPEKESSDIKCEWEDAADPDTCLQDDAKIEIKEEHVWTEKTIADVKSCKDAESQNKLQGGASCITGIDEDFPTSQSILNTEAVSNTNSVIPEKLFYINLEVGSSDCETVIKQEVDEDNTSESTHIEEHQTSEQQYTCEHCGKSFTSSSEFKKHNFIHEGKKLYNCDICEKSFTRMSHLKDHSVIHEGSRPHECEICQKRFKLLSHLKRHSSIHEGKIPYKCNICGETFVLASYLKMHYSTHEKDLQFTNYNHEGKKLYKCDICDKTFTRVSHLKEHNIIHEGRRPHECEICHKSFKLLSHLKRHCLIHEGKRPHKCNVCGKTFVLAANLKMHNFTHESDSPFKCDICSKHFTQLSHLKTHRLTHEGKKPYKCKYCEKSFSRKSYLKGHTFIHEGKKPHKCKVCEKSFRWISHFKKHTLIHEADKGIEIEVSE